MPAIVEYRSGIAEATAAPAGNATTLEGYAAVFNSRAPIGRSFIEQIAPGAFRSSLASDDVLALLHHDDGRILGRTSSGTLRLSEDAHGLAFSLDVAADTPDGQTALALVKRADLAKMSFGFLVTAEDWDDSGDIPLRTVQSVRLLEISIVGVPAYSATSVGLQGTAQSGRTAAQLVAARRARIAVRKARMEQRLRGIR